MHGEIAMAQEPRIIFGKASYCFILTKPSFFLSTTLFLMAFFCATNLAAAEQADSNEKDHRLIELISVESQSKESVVEIQSLLVELGYDAGPIDGLLGTKTLMAAENWRDSIQADIDLASLNPKAGKDPCAILNSWKLDLSGMPDNGIVVVGGLTMEVKMAKSMGLQGSANAPKGCAMRIDKQGYAWPHCNGIELTNVGCKIY